MDIITVSSKGQIAIPKKMRDELGLSAGTRLSAEIRNGSLVLTKAQEWRTLCGAAQGNDLLSALEQEKAQGKLREDSRR